MKILITYIDSYRGFLGITIHSTCGHAVTILGSIGKTKAIELAINYFLENEERQ